MKLLCFICCSHFIILVSLASFAFGLTTLQIPKQTIQKGICGEEEDLNPMATLGGLKDSTSSAHNSAETDSLARFAVEEHNKKENALLELARVVKAQEQVVAGTLHHLTLEVIDAGEKKLYEAKIWVKPWLNFKELQEFKRAGDSPSITPSDLGVKKGGHLKGWQSVPVHDPVVQDAANHAIKTIQQRSNSLLPYELQEIIHANAELIKILLKQIGVGVIFPDHGWLQG